VDPAGRFLRVRSVVGRSTDLYRGVNLDPATPREPSSAQPLASILEALRTLHDVSVTRAPKMIVLARGSDEEELRIHVDVDPVTVPDLNLEGNPELAILALHTLQPMFGEVELRDDDYTDVIDGTEPVDAAVKRFQAKTRADRAKIGVFHHGDDTVNAAPVRRARRNLTIAAVVAVAVAVTLVALWAIRAATRGAPLGATCSNNRQCESSECLSPEPYEEAPRGAQKSFKNGACTQPCRDDTECPSDMTCADALQDMGTSKPYATKRCMPVAWQTGRE